MEIKSIDEQLDAIENKTRYFLVFYGYVLSNGSHGFGYFNSTGFGFPRLEYVLEHAKNILEEKYDSACLGVTLTGIQELSAEDYEDFIESEEVEE